MTLPSWATRFGISDHEFAEIQNQMRQASAGQNDVLRSCLVSGRIPVGDYLQWASETYTLPVVRDEFFSIPADPIFWEAIKTQFTWTPAFFPLAEWQGVLLIACFEPPNFHVPFTSKYALVLATAESMEKRFREYEPKTAAAPVAKQAEAAAVVPTPTSTPAPAPAPVVAQVRQRPADEVLADDLPEAPNVSLDNPDGLVVEIPPASTPNLFVLPDGLPLEDIGKPVGIMPDGINEDSQVLNLADIDFSADHSKAPAPTRVVPKLPDAAPGATAPAAAAPAAKVLPIAPAPKTAAPTAAPVVLEKVALPQVPPAPPMPARTPMPLAPESVVTPPPVPSASASRVSSTEPAVALSTCTSSDALMTATVAHIASIFEHGLVLSYSRNELRPAKWSELLWSAKGDQPDAIKLDRPSLFKIVFKTSLPYHGFVVQSPAATAFFNDFNRGVLAKHVTLVPVLVNGQLDSMLMGISMNDVDFKATLTAMEKLAADYSLQASRFKEKKLAA